MTFSLGFILCVVWLYIYHVMKKSQLYSWKFIWGSCGLFILMMIYLRPVLTEPLAQIVASVAGVLGDITGVYSSYFKYGVIFVNTMQGSISLLIDFECSGILEIMAFLALVAFYEVYKPHERLLVGLAGCIYIVLANATRIASICTIIHFFGTDSYYMAHTIFGRIIFYVLTIILYYLVFTKAHIMRQKIGGFSYGLHK